MNFWSENAVRPRRRKPWIALIPARTGSRSSFLLWALRRPATPLRWGRRNTRFRWKALTPRFKNRFCPNALAEGGRGNLPPSAGALEKALCGVRGCPGAPVQVRTPGLKSLRLLVGFELAGQACPMAVLVCTRSTWRGAGGRKLQGGLCEERPGLPHTRHSGFQPSRPPWRRTWGRAQLSALSHGRGTSGETSLGRARPPLQAVRRAGECARSSPGSTQLRGEGVLLPPRGDRRLGEQSPCSASCALEICCPERSHAGQEKAVRSKELQRSTAVCWLSPPCPCAAQRCWEWGSGAWG